MVYDIAEAMHNSNDYGVQDWSAQSDQVTEQT